MGFLCESVLETYFDDFKINKTLTRSNTGPFKYMDLYVYEHWRQAGKERVAGERGGGGGIYLDTDFCLHLNLALRSDGI